MNKIKEWATATFGGSGNGAIQISGQESEEKNARTVEFQVKTGKIAVAVTVIQNAASWVTIYLQGAAGIGKVSNAVNGGNAVERIVGRTVRLTATTIADYVFDGWYVSGVKVSGVAVFDYVVTGSVTLTAKATYVEPPTTTTTTTTTEAPTTTTSMEPYF